MINKLFKYAPVQIFSALSLFILIALQAKYLSVEAYGVLAIFMLITEITRAFSMQWIANSMLRLYPSQTKSNKVGYISVAVSMLVSLFIPALALLIIGMLYYEIFDLRTFSLLAVFLLMKTIYLFFIDIARLDERVSLYRRSTLVQSIGAVVFTLLLLEIDNSIASVVTALIASYLLPAPFLLKRIEYESLFNKKIVGDIVNYGSPLLLSGVISMVALRADRFFIADNMSMTELGIYSGLFNIIFGIMTLVFTMTAMPLYPELTKAVGSGKLKLLHKKYFNVMLAISLPALLGFCLIAELLIQVFLTGDFLSYGVELFYVLSASIFLLNIRVHYIDHGLQFTLNTKFMPVITMAGLVLNVILLGVLIGSYGLYGAAWAMLITNIMTASVSFFLSLRLGYKYSIDKNLIKTLCASLIMVMCIYVIKQSAGELEVLYQLIVLIGCGVVSYSLAQIAFNTLDVKTSVKKLFT